ncbi:MAG: alkaline phosphatase family protein, partial [Acidobacteriota bacterium]
MGSKPLQGTTSRAPKVAVLLLALLAVTMAGGGSNGPQGPRRRVLWINWDGAAISLVRPMLEAGRLPQLAVLETEGEVAAAQSVFPTLTAPGFAALWTGAPPSINGITGNRVPPPGEPVTAGVNGFSAEMLRAEPVWAAVARQGKRVVALETPQGYPLVLFEPSGRFGGSYSHRQRLASGYARRLFYGSALPADGEPIPRIEGEPVPSSMQNVATGTVRPRLWRWPLQAAVGPVEGAPEQLWVWSFDDPDTPGNGYDAVLVSADPQGRSAVRVPVQAANPQRLHPETQAVPPGFVQIEVDAKRGPIPLYLRCWQLAADGTPRCYHSEARVELSSDAALSATLEAAAAGFVSNGGSASYQRGDFGPPLWEGGDGSAEARYLDTVALVVGHLSARHRAVAAASDWDLLITYLPYPDEAMHLWWGWVAPGSPASDISVGARLRPFLERVVQWLDATLGTTRKAAGEGITLVISSDHGHLPANRLFRPNPVLQQAGLLSIRQGPSGAEVELADTRVLYYSGNNAYLLVNGTDRRGGVVPDERREQVLAAAERA